MSVPDYRIASVWWMVKEARRAKIALVVLTSDEELAAARSIKRIRVCTCTTRPEPHVHTRDTA